MIDQMIPMMIQSSWQILILSLIVWPLSRLSVRAYPNFAYALWVVILIKALIPIGITLPVQQVQVVALPPVITGEYFLEATAAQTSTLFSFKNIVGLIWLLGVVFFATRILLSEITHRRRIRSSQILIPEPWFTEMKAELGIKQQTRLFIGDGVQSPLMHGLFKVHIHLPEAYREWDIDEKRSILAHELIHVRRRDMLVIYLQAIVKVLYFFHPAVWMVNDQIDLEREKICDDEAIDLARSDRGAYGQQLYKHLESQTGSSATPVLAGGFFMSDNSILKRFRYIKEKRGNMKNKLKFYHLLLILVVASVAVVIACSTDTEPNIVEPESLEKGVDISSEQKWDYDTPPEPVGGFAAIQKNIKYPELARKAGIEGTTFLNLVIDEDGSTSDVRVLKSAGDTSLDSAAIKATEKSTWIPAKLEGKPVKLSMAIPIVFKLKQDVETDEPKTSQPYSEKARWRPIDPPGPVTITLSGPNAREEAKDASIQLYIEREGSVSNSRVRAPGSLDIKNESYRETRSKWSDVKWEAVPEGSNPEPMWFELPKEFIFVD